MIIIIIIIIIIIMKFLHRMSLVDRRLNDVLEVREISLHIILM